MDKCLDFQKREQYKYSQIFSSFLDRLYIIRGKLQNLGEHDVSPEFIFQVHDMFTSLYTLFVYLCSSK